MLMTACSTSSLGKALDREASSAALCEGLKVPLDDFAGELVTRQKNTPDEVIIKGTKVIRIVDSGCS